LKAFQVVLENENKSLLARELNVYLIYHLKLSEAAYNDFFHIQKRSFQIFHKIF